MLSLANPGPDRIACPWLLARFIDPSPEWPEPPVLSRQKQESPPRSRRAAGTVNTSLTAG
ncbi:chromate resistance protein ChrB domain-containing protein [Cupriavidus yeoncheonensis]|uniref:chromate resistance protein ChrB domain-containing protein n=1 Tax=Cupriavidus yeoncheonensis TaxID=1462994 RepID=UPI001BAC2165|nr:chromate resistance protein ChrB domain-containing protein [Cupriavidus yeoncheonensis]